MKSTMKKIGLIVAIYGAVFGVVGLGTRIANNCLNNRTTERPAYHLVSNATGISGHVEYTMYKDGSSDVKVYPGLGHRMWDSKLYQDMDGDGLVDRIRKNGAEYKMNRLSELLVRDTDYSEHQKKFDQADGLLQKLSMKYQ